MFAVPTAAWDRSEFGERVDVRAGNPAHPPAVHAVATAEALRKSLRVILCFIGDIIT